ncbi:MAG: toxin-antitoxin system HicB family antitoxin [Anaerolineales bacterium]|jgi:hypothetical protein|nr:toxin-antitoxin system HicB family antitoxin [Anaerolineales bacterium]
MSELTLQLPDTLYQQLEELALDEGVSLSHYILYTLTNRVASANSIQILPPEQVSQQRANFETLLQKLGKASKARVDEILATRPAGSADPDLNPETVKKIKQLIHSKNK